MPKNGTCRNIQMFTFNNRFVVAVQRSCQLLQCAGPVVGDLSSISCVVSARCRMQATTAEFLDDHLALITQ
jgi:hypothetical protein